jgi:hypothetical protein
MNNYKFKNKINFHPEKNLKIEASFTKSDITSDGGLLLLRELEKKYKIIKQFVDCFKDYRNQPFCSYDLYQLISQRIYGICAGYEDLNDHDILKKDYLFSCLTKSKNKEIAGKSTLNRLELSSGNYCHAKKDRYKKIVINDKKAEQFFIKFFLQAHKTPPKKIILDFDPSDITIHGNQEGKFFHGYYKDNCFLPLYVFANGFLLVAKLRRSNIDGAYQTKKILKKIVTEIRKKWKNVEIIFRADSGFARDEIMSWCENNNVEYIISLPKNSRLLKKVEVKAQKLKEKVQKRKKDILTYTSFKYKTEKSWFGRRKVIAKLENSFLKETIFDFECKVRFVVTSLKGRAKALYEKSYCPRGDMENRIKEKQNDMYGSRTSASKMRANQLRLWFSGIAYSLLHLFRIKALKNTSMRSAQCSTIRLRLIKVGGLVKISLRRMLVQFSENYVFKQIYLKALFAIQRMKPLIC